MDITRVLLSITACVLLTSSAHANIAAPQPDPAVLSNVGVAGSEGIEVASEQLELICYETDERPECSFVATYVFANPTETEVSAVAAFYGRFSEGVLIASKAASRSRAWSAIKRSIMSISSRATPSISTT